MAWKVFISKGLNWSYVDASSSLIYYLERSVEYKKDFDLYVGQHNKLLKDLDGWNRSQFDHAMEYRHNPSIFRFWTFKGEQ